MIIIIGDFVNFECLDFIEGFNDLSQVQGLRLIAFFKSIENEDIDFVSFDCNTATLAFTTYTDYKDYHKDRLIISTIGKQCGLDYLHASLDSGHRLDFEFLV
jgi:hypothetical protein